MKDNRRDAVIVAYGRSPLAKANKGSFAGMHPLDYGAQTLKGVLNRLPGFDPALIDDVIVGNAFPQGKCGYNIGRMVAQKAGLPDSVPGVTVNRFCSSGIQTIAMAANAIMADQMDVVIAGGVEQMTGLNMMMPEEYRDQLLEKEIPGLYMSMGMTAENVAEKYGISRSIMEIMAAESHRKAAIAQASGEFDREIIPITVTGENGEAVPRVLKRTGLTIDDMDVIEINEAFASQAIACIRTLGLPEEKVNPNGGAMALGHPLGATGAVLTSKVLSYLERKGGRYGLITMCIGGGMGAAGIVEME